MEKHSEEELQLNIHRHDDHLHELHVMGVLAVNTNEEWVNGGQLQSQVGHSIHPASVLLFYAIEGKPFSYR